MQAGGECRFRRTTDLGGHLLWVDTGRRSLPANFLTFCQVVPSGCLQVQSCMGTPGTASAENRYSASGRPRGLCRSSLSRTRVENQCRIVAGAKFSTVLRAMGTRSLGLSIAYPLASRRAAVARQLWADKIASSGHPSSVFRVVVVLLIEPHHSAGCTGDPSDMFRLLRFRDRGRTPCARSIMSWGMPICRASSMSVRGVM